MNYVGRSRSGRIALLAAGATLLSSATFAQSIRTFDDAPSIEQLRSIMIPESHAGAGRTIVMQRPNVSATQKSVQAVSTETVATPQPSTVAANPPPTSVPVPAPAPAAQPAAAPLSASRASEPAPQAGVVAFHINFAFDSAALPDSAHAMIDRVAQLMKEAPELKLRVEGHTDATGSADYNLSLSEERALAVAQYLAAQGVERSRLILVGKGKTEPLTRDPYEPANRRVQFVRVG